MAKEKKILNFLELANNIIDQTFENGDGEYGMTVADHKLICKILDAHEDYVDEKIVDKFIAGIAEHYGPIMNVLEKLEKGLERLDRGQDAILKDIQMIKEWQSKTEKRIIDEEAKSNNFEARLADKKKRIETIELKVALLDCDAIADIRALKPAILHLLNAFKWWRIVIYITIVITLFMLIHYLFL